MIKIGTSSNIKTNRIKSISVVPNTSNTKPNIVSASQCINQTVDLLFRVCFRHADEKIIRTI